MTKYLILSVAAAATIACGQQATKNTPATPAAPTATATAGEAANENVTRAAETITGEVLEAHDAPGLTYLRLKTATGEVWTAVNQTPVKVGATATVHASMKAKDFRSDALKKTFDEITFGSLEGAPGPKPGTIAQGGPVPFFEAEKPVSVDLTNVTVPKAPGPNAMTISEMWHQKASLSGKTVAVRGKAVKVLGNVIQKNWVHIRDGSGSDKVGDHELIITTAEPIRPGDVFIATGIVSVDAEIGGGLEYPILMQDPKIKK